MDGTLMVRLRLLLVETLLLHGTEENDDMVER